MIGKQRFVRIGTEFACRLHKKKKVTTMTEEEKINMGEEEILENQENSDNSEHSEDSENTEGSENTENAEPAEEKDPLEVAQEQIEQLKTQILYKTAEFDNYRKRMMQEKQDAFDYGNANLLKDLLDSLDNFDRTLDAAKDAKDAKSIADGIKMINKSLVSMLENKYNLVAFGKEGDAFDPDLHEAIGMQEGKVKKEELAAVYLKGYKLKDKVIRHAKVMVVKPAE